MIIQRCRAALSGTLILGMFGFVFSSKAETANNQHNTGIANRGSSCTESNSLSRRVDFADLDRARHVLGHGDEWARQLSDFDRGVRQETAVPTSLREFLAFTEEAGMRWTAQEETAWTALIDKLSKAMKG